MQIKIAKMSSSEYEQSRVLRNKILLAPIGQPDGAFEMHDHQCTHIVAVDESRGVIACVVLKPEHEGVGRLMQMAVASSAQRTGVGSKLVRYLCEQALDEGYSEVICHARDDVTGFYSELGFVEFGEPFVEAGIGHINMRYKLSSSR